MKPTITNPVTLEHHGSYKHLHRQCARVREFIETHWDKILPMADIPGDLNIRLRPLPKRRIAGNGSLATGVMLDISRGLRDIISTLMHELVHVEQFKQGRLKTTCVGRKTVCYWKGDCWGPMRLPGNTKRSADKYDEQPWEKEARDRQEKMTIGLEAMIGPIPNDIL